MFVCVGFFVTAIGDVVTAYYIRWMALNTNCRHGTAYTDSIVNPISGVCVRSITIKWLPCFSFWWIDVIVCTTVWRGYSAGASINDFVFYWWRAEKVGQPACIRTGPQSHSSVEFSRYDVRRAKPYLVCRNKTTCAVRGDLPISILNWKFIWYAKRPPQRIQQTTHIACAASVNGCSSAFFFSFTFLQL